MKKLLFSLLIVLSLGVLLFGCKEEVLKVITFSGVDEAEVEYNSEFNILAGVKAVGDDNKDYSNLIKYSTTADHDSTTNLLNTKKAGKIFIRYSVKVVVIVNEKTGEEKTVSQEVDRWVTVKEPVATGDELIANGDFSLGVNFWTTGSWEGGKIAVSVENEETDPVFVVNVSALGPNGAHDPRFSQSGIKFQNGKTYEISFRAKSSVEKNIHLQVGELIDAAPWFNNFNAGNFEYRVITTEWAEYSYKFTHRQNNENGTILFEFGPVSGPGVDAAKNVPAEVRFDWIKVEESTPDPDTKGPRFTGAVDKTIFTGDAFDPMAGVTAYDLEEDKDYTDKVTVEIKDEGGAVVPSISTANTGVFTVTYKVKDSSNNETTLTITIQVAVAGANIITNGDFETLVGHNLDHSGAGEAACSFELVEGGAKVTINLCGDDVYKPHYNTMVGTLEAGTYTMKVRMTPSVSRTLIFKIVETNGWAGLGEKKFSTVANEEITVELTFTLAATTTNCKVEIDFGTIPEGVSLPGEFILHHIELLKS